MTIENYGKIWTLDHTIPISSFNLSNENEKRKCFFWCNLRPMYIKDNLLRVIKLICGYIFSKRSKQNIF